MLSAIVTQATAEYEAKKQNSPAELFKKEGVTLEEVLTRRDVQDYLVSLQSKSAYYDLKTFVNIMAFVDDHEAELVRTITESSKAMELLYQVTANAGGEGSPVRSFFLDRSGSDEVMTGSLSTFSFRQVSPQGNMSLTGRSIQSPTTGAPSGEANQSSPEAEVVGGEEKKTAQNDGVDVSMLALKVDIGCELLSYFAGGGLGPQVLDTVVPVSMVVLQQSNTLSTASSLSIQRALLINFEKFHEETTKAIAKEVNHASAAAMVRSLAVSSIVAETIIAIFGSALSAETMMCEMTHAELFTRAWLESDFAVSLAEYVGPAMRDSGRYNYFYFLRELLKRGHSHSAGPVVDVLLTRAIFAPFVETIVAAVKESNAAKALRPSESRTSCSFSAMSQSALPQPRTGPAVPVLVGDAVGVLVYAVGVVRKSLVVPDTVSEYYQVVEFSDVLTVVTAHASEFCAGIQFTVHQDSRKFDSIASPFYETLGKTNLAIIELLSELSLCGIAATDDAVSRCGFIRTLLDVCREYPNHDALIRILYHTLLSLLTRAPMVGETLDEFLRRDILIRDLCADGAPKDKRGNDSTQQPPQKSVLAQLAEFACSWEYRYSPLSSFCIDLLKIVSRYPLFSVAFDGVLAGELEVFTHDSSAAVRLESMDEPITGEKFRSKGSAGTEKPVHHPMINCVVEPTLNFSLSDLSSDTGKSSNSSGSPFTPLPPTPTLNVSDVSSAAGAPSGLSSPPPLPQHHDPNDPSGFIVQRVADAVDEGTQPPPIDLEAVRQEGDSLRAAGSPQMRAFPSFNTLVLSFPSTDADTS